MFRIGIANIRFPAAPEELVTLAEQASVQASSWAGGIVCFPECFVPGYRGMGKLVPPADPAFLERAWSGIAAAAAKASIAVVLGTERVVDGSLVITALVVNPDGTIAGFQDKCQIDPSEEPIYTAGSWQRVFPTGPLAFGNSLSPGGLGHADTDPSAPPPCGH